MNNIGGLIKVNRKKAGLTQIQLAEKANISKNALWNYENDRRTPSIDTLNDIAFALGISNSEFLEVQNDFTDTINKIYNQLNSTKEDRIMEHLSVFKYNFSDIEFHDFFDDYKTLQNGIHTVLKEYLILSTNMLTNEKITEYIPAPFPDSMEEIEERAKAWVQFKKQYNGDLNEAQKLLDKMAKYIFELNWNEAQNAAFSTNMKEGE